MCSKMTPSPVSRLKRCLNFISFTALFLVLFKCNKNLDTHTLFWFNLTLGVLELGSTAPHAVVLTLMRERYYFVYLYMLCRLMY